jgi:hypothetical protein
VSGSEKSGSVELVTIPAVPGRLLRFEGDSLHAVPRPANLWLLKFVQGAANYEPEEEWGRSVILFNTWDEPPLDVPTDSPKTDDDSTGPCSERSEWSQTYATEYSAIEEVCIDEDETDSKVPANPLRTLKLFAPPNLSDALQETTKVTRVLLSNKHR